MIGANIFDSLPLPPVLKQRTYTLLPVYIHYIHYLEIDYKLRLHWALSSLSSDCFVSLEAPVILNAPGHLPPLVPDFGSER